MNGDLPPLESILADSIWSAQGEPHWDFPINHTPPSVQESHGRAFRLQDESLLGLDSMQGHAPRPTQQNSGAVERMVTEASPASPSDLEHRSLDKKPGRSAALIGFSNESDPFLLDHYPYDSTDECQFFKVIYRKLATAVSPSPTGGLINSAPVHILQSHSDTATEARTLVDKCFSSTDERKHLEELVDSETGIALVKL